MQIIPAILTSEVQELDLLLRQIRDSKKFERVQIDFVDGEYAANKSVRVEECKSIREYRDLKFDAHLMVTENNIVEWSKMAQKFGFDRIIAQVESISRPEDFACLALDIHSPVDVIKSYLPKLDLVVLMAIEPGLGGQEFDPKIAEKISYLSNLRNLGHLSFQIAIDGGVEKNHLQMLEDLGVNEVVVGARRVLEW